MKSEKFDTIKETESKLITIALAKTGGNREKAAKLLGIKPGTLRQRITERRRNDF